MQLTFGPLKMRLSPPLTLNNVARLSLFALAAIAGNVLNVQLFWGIQALFGSIAVLLVIRFHGARWGVAVAFLSGVVSALLLQNPHTMLVQMGEAVALGLTFRRLSNNLALLDGLFWLMLGLPLTAALVYVTAGGGAMPLIMALHAGINGVFNALAAGLLTQAILLWRWRGVSHERENALTLRQLLFTLLVSSALAPALLVMVLDARHQYEVMQAGIQGGLIAEAATAYHQQEIVAMLTRSFLILSGITAVAFFFGWLLSRWLVNPLEQLAGETSNLRFKLLDGRAPDLPDVPVAEMESLVLNFRETATSLSRSFNELYNLNETLEARVAERTQALSQSNLQLQQEVAIRTEQALQLGRTTAELETQKFALDQHSIVSIADQKGAITYVNDKFCQVSQYGRDELLGQDHRILNSAYHPHAFFQEMWVAIGQGRVWQGMIRNRRKNGEFYWVDTTIVPFMDVDGRPYQFVSIRTDITERKRFEEDLIHAKEAAEEASRAKSEFLSRMSHELRTPLNAIIGFTQLLESGMDGELSEGQRESAASILQAGWHLLDLISEILDLARIESGRMAITLEEVELGPLLDECVDMVMPLANERHILINDAINQAAEVFRVHADRTRLKQVLLNLMSNAVKYNRPEGALTLACARSPGGMVRLEVADTGIGISAGRMGELFQPFSRLDADKSETQGAGVGLAVTKSLVELMGGRIGVESEAGKGSVFWIELVEDPAA
jgi:PAS domain S-box-containing protein